MKYYIFLCLSFFFVSNLVAQDTEWVSLFNGKDLNNFTKLNGEATYEIEDNCIVGISRMGTPNTFLATKKMYGDFILEYEVLIDPVLNSGVQIRSNSFPAYQKGRVHGYQVEIDPSARAFSGGIYDEARRGWIYPLSRNPKGRTAFRNGQWNHYRVEAIGNTIKTWINGIQCTHLIDDETAEGFIALQVHSIGDKKQEGKEIRWRNLKILNKDLTKHILPNDPQVPQLSYLVNQLTDWEKTHGWRLLWDGKTSKGWKGAKLDQFPKNDWIIKDGTLSIEGKDVDKTTGLKDIVTEEVFANFELELEFKISEGADSGIKYFVQSGLNKKADATIGCEFQIIDDRKNPAAKKGVKGNRMLGSLYDLMPAENLSIPNRGKQFKGTDVWNQARIVVRDGIVEHWLNNEKTLEYDRWSPMFRALVAYSQHKDWDKFGQQPEGAISLQNNGSALSFRSIKIRAF